MTILNELCPASWGLLHQLILVLAQNLETGALYAQALWSTGGLFLTFYTGCSFDIFVLSFHLQDIHSQIANVFMFPSLSPNVGFVHGAK